MMSAGDVRKVLGVSYERIRLLRLMGKIRGERTTVGWIYDPESVYEYLRQREEWKRGRRNA
jgi:cellulose synthase/poly-beta-1,6-N-acetylglucosamine synthase-like glycosyltransferase